LMTSLSAAGAVAASAAAATRVRMFFMLGGESG
jgi:hypothetical protein